MATFCGYPGPIYPIAASSVLTGSDTFTVTGQMYNVTSGYVGKFLAYGCGGATITASLNIYPVPVCKPQTAPVCPIVIDAFGEGFHLTDATKASISVNAPAVHSCG